MQPVEAEPRSIHIGWDNRHVQPIQAPQDPVNQPSVDLRSIAALPKARQSAASERPDHTDNVKDL
jgi:hypothetical protein